MVRLRWNGKAWINHSGAVSEYSMVYRSLARGSLNGHFDGSNRKAGLGEEKPIAALPGGIRLLSDEAKSSTMPTATGQDKKWNFFMESRNRSKPGTKTTCFCRTRMRRFEALEDKSRVGRVFVFTTLHDS